MKELSTENLQALLRGEKLNTYQLALANKEYKDLILFTYKLENEVKQLTMPVVGSSTFFKVTFSYDKSQQGRSVWRHEEKVFEVNTADELDSKIKAYISECTTRLVDRWYYMKKTKIEKM